MSRREGREISIDCLIVDDNEEDSEDENIEEPWSN